MRWEKVNLSNSSRLRETGEGKKAPGRKGGILGPGKRWGHTCNSVRGGRFLYVFGGYGKDNCQTNDVHVFDTNRQTWSKPMVKGLPPSPRDSHSCTTVGNNLFVFGGTDGKVPLKDLHVLDTSTNMWLSPTVRGTGPEAREGHSAALVGKRLFIFGGCGKSRSNSEEIYYNDLYILDTETFEWRCAVPSGTPPSARDSHTCSSWKNKIIVVAGEDASDYYLSDVHILDTETFVWRELNALGQILPPRAGHSAVTLGKNLFVFGGFTDDRNLYDDLHLLNLETGVWTKVLASGQVPSARFSVAGDCLDASKGLLVFIGGCNEHLEALDDMYYLHTDISVENGQEEHRPVSLRKELKRKCLEQYTPAGLPAISKIAPQLRSVPDMSLPMPLPSYVQSQTKSSPVYELRPPQEKLFEAKVTEAFQYGYTIETIIDGKPLRGILFSHKPAFAHTDGTHLSRKSINDGVGSLNLNDYCSPKPDTDTPMRDVKEDHKQTDDVHAKESALQGSPMEITPASNPKNSTSFDVLHPQMSLENSKTSILPPDLREHKMEHRPNSGINSDKVVPSESLAETIQNVASADNSLIQDSREEKMDDRPNNENNNDNVDSREEKMDDRPNSENDNDIIFPSGSPAETTKNVASANNSLTQGFDVVSPKD
ncbi:hypothetical protein Sjap_014974 [Stephania japonica]|uniref:Uncharacterized protein n=1 Tax=Stephania japonica TaxID=461633 RepID=A0AAP0IK58_9MAGN